MYLLNIILTVGHIQLCSLIFVAVFAAQIIPKINHVLKQHRQCVQINDWTQSSDVE